MQTLQRQTFLCRREQKKMQASGAMVESETVGQLQFSGGCLRCVWSQEAWCVLMETYLFLLPSSFLSLQQKNFCSLMCDVSSSSTFSLPAVTHRPVQMVVAGRSRKETVFPARSSRKYHDWSGPTPFPTAFPQRGCFFLIQVFIMALKLFLKQSFQDFFLKLGSGGRKRWSTRWVSTKNMFS